MGYSLSESKKGFTIIELCVVILILAILIGIGSEAVFDYQKKARDTERRSDVTVISQALERYYRTQAVAIGVTYPPTATTIAALGDIVEEREAVKAPDQTTTSMTMAATAGAQSPLVNQYIYQPLNLDDSLCTTSPCVRYKIYYRLEETNEIVVKNSMRQQ